MFAVATFYTVLGLPLSSFRRHFTQLLDDKLPRPASYSLALSGKKSKSVEFKVKCAIIRQKGSGVAFDRSCRFLKKLSAVVPNELN
jgi:hypothetical protein